MLKNLPKNFTNKFKLQSNKLIIIFTIISTLLLIVLLIVSSNNRNLNTNINKFTAENKKLSENLDIANKKIKDLESDDQFVKNKKLTDEIKKIYDNYKNLMKTYEKLVDLKLKKPNTPDIDKLFAQSLDYLSEKNYASASSVIENIKLQIDQQNLLLANSLVKNTENLPVNNQAPGSGFSRQKVKTDFGEYIVDIVAADLNSTKVIIDTASDGDCADNCPVLSLGTYVARSGGFAGINGSYFCPASYPSCAGKTNSFDTLVMNKNKFYFNSANNVYSTVPAVIFSSGNARFVSQSLQWGRDTGVDGVIANQPLLVLDGNVVFGGDGEIKRATAGSRSFVGSTGSTVYIGVVHNVNAAQMARVLQTMGVKNALNLDSGGSTALWSGGYKVGPGRDIPNAIIFVRK